MGERAVVQESSGFFNLSKIKAGLYLIYFQILISFFTVATQVDLKEALSGLR